MNPDPHPNRMSVEDSKEQYAKSGIALTIKCNAKGCNDHARYSIPGYPAMRCREHSQFGDCVFPSTACEAMHCADIAQYGSIGRPRFCVTHHVPSMKNLMIMHKMNRSHEILGSLLSSTSFKLVKSAYYTSDFMLNDIYLNTPYYIYRSPLSHDAFPHHVVVGITFDITPHPFMSDVHGTELCNFARKFNGTVSLIMLSCNPMNNRVGWKSVQDKKESLVMEKFTELMNMPITSLGSDDPYPLINDMVYINDSDDQDELVSAVSYKNLAKRYVDSFIRDETAIEKKRVEEAYLRIVAWFVVCVIVVRLAYTFL